jgi:hypothetical protein
LVEVLVGVRGSYTVAGRNVGGSEEMVGVAVTDEGGSYTGERGLARRGLDVGDRLALCAVVVRGGEELRREGDEGRAAAPLTVSMGLLAERGPALVTDNLREKLGWW